MANQKKVLGKGLGALLGGRSSNNPPESQNIQSVALDHIVPNPYQPRKDFPKESIRELAESIERSELLQPIVLRKSDQGYEIVSGERRFRAFESLGRSEIPAIIKDFTDQQMLINALIENIQREDLNPIDEAQSFLQLREDFQLTHVELAQVVGKSRSHITNSLRLLKLPESILDYVKNGLLSPGAARALLPLEDDDLIRKVSQETIVQGLNVRQVEAHVKNILNASDVDESASKSPRNHELESQYSEELSSLTGLPCQVKFSKKKPNLSIKFNSEEDLQRFMNLFQTTKY